MQNKRILELIRQDVHKQRHKPAVQQQENTGNNYSDRRITNMFYPEEEKIKCKSIIDRNDCDPVYRASLDTEKTPSKTR